MRTLDEIYAEGKREARQRYIEDSASGAIRFTAAGVREYRARFAKAGIDIRTIKTQAAFKAACLASRDVWADELREMVKGDAQIARVVKETLG